MRIISQPITRHELNAMLPGYFGNMVKAVVDVDLGYIGLNAELQADIESAMLEQGAMLSNLWGIKLYPNNNEVEIEFDSLINIRPHQGNHSRNVQNSVIRERIRNIVNTLII